ncbi:carboxypeptidase N subunit 2 [Caerostris darwini]|uniref:Carboxypeptidase N subunit 2 n=1 Tax=Caerostris darwini TaxID=1538125 RepID=A0AAV4RL94_9ARAC|nr:carboxypeptidase N subunit 2 [Caerostris darwini]
MSELENLFNDDLNYKPVSVLKLVHCEARTVPKTIFSRVFISKIVSSCPFDVIENDALSSIQSLYELNLQFTAFSTIPKAINNLKYLKHLFITDGKLTQIDPELQNMASLQSIKLARNHIRQVSSKAFSRTLNVKVIDLSHNELIHLHPGTFNECAGLKKINLQKNSLTSVDSLFNVYSLLDINLRDNNLESIDDAFQHDLRLEILNLGMNPLKNISESTLGPNIKQLQELILDQCQLAFLPPKIFQHLAKLEKLDLSFNRLTSLPTEIFHSLHNLKEINLQENRITHLNDVFSQNYRIESIKLCENLIQTCEGYFNDLGYLKYLDLRDNQLGALTKQCFSKSLFIHTLLLSKNSIRRIDKDAFTSLTELKNLTLDSNMIRFLNGSIRNLGELEVLKLHNNLFEEIGDSELSHLPKLRLLNLARNHLSNVNGAFRNLINLRHLIITQNKLTRLTRRTFPEEFRIEKMSVSGNKWICDCRLNWILNLKTGKDLAGQFRCIKPVMFHGKKLDQLVEMDQNILSEDCSPLCQCTCVTKDNDYYVRVDCSRKGLTQIPAVLPEEIGELHLQDNRLTSLSDLDKHSLERLRYLNVERNLLDKLDCNLSKNLETLMLARNRFQRFPTNFPSNVSTWTLSNNYWLCDCKAIAFLKFLKTEKSKVKDINSIKCSDIEGNPELYGKTIRFLTVYELCPEKGVSFLKEQFHID